MNPPVSERPSGSCHRDLSYPGCLLPGEMRVRVEGGTFYHILVSRHIGLFTLFTLSLVVRQVFTTQSIMSIRFFIHLFDWFIKDQQYLHFLALFHCLMENSILERLEFHSYGTNSIHMEPIPYSYGTNSIFIWNHIVPQFLIVLHYTFVCNVWNRILSGQHPTICW